MIVDPPSSIPIVQYAVCPPWISYPQQVSTLYPSPILACLLILSHAPTTARRWILQSYVVKQVVVDCLAGDVPVERNQPDGKRNVPVFGIGVARQSGNAEAVYPARLYFFSHLVSPPTHHLLLSNLLFRS